MDAGNGPRWLVPLSDFIGAHEPSDDDSDEWIIRDVVPRGEPWLLAGKWKGGKTWTAISLAVHVALGEDWLRFANCLGRPGRVLLVTLEDNRSRIARRVWRVMAGAGVVAGDARHARLVENLRVSEAPIKFPSQANALIAEVREWQPDVILIDSLTRAMEGDQNSIRDAGAFTDAWRNVVRETGAAVCPLHHTNRSVDYRPEADPMSQIRGSGELLAAPRHIVVMTPIAEQGAHKSHVRMGGNLEVERGSFVLEYEQVTEAGRTVVRLHDRGDHSPSEGKAERRVARAAAKVARANAERDSREVKILAYAAAHPMERVTGGVAASIVGLSHSKAGSVLAALRKAGDMDATTITAKGRSRLCTPLPPSREPP